MRPGADQGYAACAAARADSIEIGQIGAGAGATVAKWRGDPRPGGIGSASIRDGELVVGALVVANAWGEPRGPERVDLAGTSQIWEPFASTTIGVIATNARLTKGECLLVAQSGHDGLARALEPAHTAFDGDALVAGGFATWLIGHQPRPHAPFLTTHVGLLVSNSTAPE